ncbi:hypothetical protein OIV83_002007 [Microbotryomycetes sp. JL201]|nr:hypothetical protein OIV83_002007 [Microbotryomycetes sp. JL201]
MPISPSYLLDITAVPLKEQAVVLSYLRAEYARLTAVASTCLVEKQHLIDQDVASRISSAFEQTFGSARLNTTIEEAKKLLAGSHRITQAGAVIPTHDAHSGTSQTGKDGAYILVNDFIHELRDFALSVVEAEVIEQLPQVRLRRVVEQFRAEEREAEHQITAYCCKQRFPDAFTAKAIALLSTGLDLPALLSHVALPDSGDLKPQHEPLFRAKQIKAFVWQLVFQFTKNSRSKKDPNRVDGTKTTIHLDHYNKIAQQLHSNPSLVVLEPRQDHIRPLRWLLWMEDRLVHLCSLLTASYGLDTRDCAFHTSRLSRLHEDLKIAFADAANTNTTEGAIREQFERKVVTEETEIQKLIATKYVQAQNQLTVLRRAFEGALDSKAHTPALRGAAKALQSNVGPGMSTQTAVWAKASRNAAKIQELLLEIISDVDGGKVRLHGPAATTLMATSESERWFDLGFKVIDRSMLHHSMQNICLKMSKSDQVTEVSHLAEELAVKFVELTSRRYEDGQARLKETYIEFRKELLCHDLPDTVFAEVAALHHCTERFGLAIGPHLSGLHLDKFSLTMRSEIQKLVETFKGHLMRTGPALHAPKDPGQPFFGTLETPEYLEESHSEVLQAAAKIMSDCTALSGLRRHEMMHYYAEEIKSELIEQYRKVKNNAHQLTKDWYLTLELRFLVLELLSAASVDLVNGEAHRLSWFEIKVNMVLWCETARHVFRLMSITNEPPVAYFEHHQPALAHSSRNSAMGHSTPRQARRYGIKH